MGKNKPKKNKVKEGDFNKKLLESNIFRKLVDFKSALWLRRLGVSYNESGKRRTKEADFLILNMKRPKLAVVECGRELSEDNVKQLQIYCNAINKASAEEIVGWIVHSLTSKNKKGIQDRGKANNHAPMKRIIPEDNDKYKNELIKIIIRAKKHSVIGILLWYVTDKANNKLRLLKEIKLPKNSWFPYNNWRLCLVG